MNDDQWQQQEDTRRLSQARAALIALFHDRQTTKLYAVLVRLKDLSASPAEQVEALDAIDKDAVSLDDATYGKIRPYIIDWMRLAYLAKRFQELTQVPEG